MEFATLRLHQLLLVPTILLLAASSAVLPSGAQPVITTPRQPGAFPTKRETIPPIKQEGYQAPSGKKFCVPKAEATDAQLQSNLDWACSVGTDCSLIQPGAPCSEPVTVRSRASFAINSYFRNHGEDDKACDFSGTGQVTTVDPSYGNCRYI